MGLGVQAEVCGDRGGIGMSRYVIWAEHESGSPAGFLSKGGKGFTVDPAWVRYFTQAQDDRGEVKAMVDRIAKRRGIVWATAIVMRGDEVPRVELDEGEAEAATAPKAECDLFVCGWGAYQHFRGRDRDVLKIVREAGKQPHCLAVTKDGHPGHPLFLKGDLKPVPFGIGGGA